MNNYFSIIKNIIKLHYGLICLMALLFNNSYSQKLTLTDLTSLCNKQNWEDVNQTLIGKKWTFYSSQKGDDFKYHTIIWSYNKNYYDDKAQGWFYLFTYEGYPNKIAYTVHNKESYTTIQNSISSASFKLTNSEIFDDEVISTYNNSKYTLKISTSKRNDDNWDKSVTAYTFTIIKKSGVYDEDNGKKTYYYEDGSVKAEYTLENGKTIGKSTLYNSNGSISQTGNYINGMGNGLFKVYDDYGNLVEEYTLLNDQLHGTYSFYENGKLTKSINYNNDFKEGDYSYYYYDKNSEELILKEIGTYSNNEKNGKWTLIYTKNADERIMSFESYNNGILDGPFQEINSDSLIIGNYKNGLLHGEYKIYFDLNKQVNGGVINTDITKLDILSEGYYSYGLKSGFWKYYFLLGSISSEGNYKENKKNGEWKYYYFDFEDPENKRFSFELYFVRNFEDGKLNGKSTQYSYFKETIVPCNDINNNKISNDSCVKQTITKMKITSHFKDDKLNGLFEILDSNNNMITKGNYIDDVKQGEWIEGFYNGNENIFFYEKGNYINDNKEGIWLGYYSQDKINISCNYKNNVLNGECLVWNDDKSLKKKKHFNNGNLTELITYDSLGLNPLNKFVIYDDQKSWYRCEWTVYKESGNTSQEYFVKKENEINHELFEINFLTAISSGTKGYKDGAYKLYNDNNKLVMMGNYYLDYKTGSWEFYFYDQNVKIHSNYEQNKPTDEKYYDMNGQIFSGEFIFYDVINGIIEKRQVTEGLRNGKTVYIDEKTKNKIKKEKYLNGVLKE